MSSTNTAIIRRFALLEHNPRVRQYFRDIDDGEAANLEGGRALARQACLVDNQDTIDIIQFKMWLFNDYIARSDNVPFYGIPVTRFHSESVEYKPQVLLYFQGNKEDEDGQPGLLSAEISFRLFWEENSISMARLESLARKIKAEMATPRYRWRKGTEIVTYWKPADGFELRLYVVNKTEGIQVVRKIVSLSDKEFDPSCINRSESDRTFPVNPGTEVVLGKTQKKKRRRPIGDVTFEYAQFSWHKLAEPIILVNTGRRFRRALEYVSV